MIDETLIFRAKTIEQNLQSYQLWANMIPRGSWYSNLRNILPEKEWDNIKKMVYQYYNYKCSVCKNTGPLHALETWEYDYDEEKQTLKDIQGLCYLCLMSQHLGYIQVKLISSGELTMEELEEHWIRVNNKSKEEFFEHKYLAFELWEIRSLISWRLFDQNGIILSEL